MLLKDVYEEVVDFVFERGVPFAREAEELAAEEESVVEVVDLVFCRGVPTTALEVELDEGLSVVYPAMGPVKVAEAVT